LAENTKAHQRYRSKKGFIVPGVTTIISQLDKPALVPWAWKLGMEGIDYRKVTQQAADIGTITHKLIECFLLGQNPGPLDEFPLRSVQQAQVAFHNFEEWWTQQGFETVGAEIQLVNEKYLYGGTIDNVARRKADNRYIVLNDVKTSKAIYPEMIVQLAAYWRMWDSVHPDQKISAANIIQLNKETGAIAFHPILGDLDTEWQIFQHLRDLYELRGRTDKKRRSDDQYRLPWWYD